MNKYKKLLNLSFVSTLIVTSLSILTLSVTSLISNQNSSNNEIQQTSNQVYSQSDLSLGEVDAFYLNKKYELTYNTYSFNLISSEVTFVIPAQQLYDNGLTTVDPILLPTYNEFMSSIKSGSQIDPDFLEFWWEVKYWNISYNTENSYIILNQQQMLPQISRQLQKFFCSQENEWYITFEIILFQEYEKVLNNVTLDETQFFDEVWNENLNEILTVNYVFQELALVNIFPTTEFRITTINLVDSSFYADSQSIFVADFLSNLLINNNELINLSIEYQNTSTTSNSRIFETTSAVSVVNVPNTYDEGVNGTDYYSVYPNNISSDSPSYIWLWVVIGIIGLIILSFFFVKWKKSKKTKDNTQNQTSEPEEALETNNII